MAGIFDIQRFAFNGNSTADQYYNTLSGNVVYGNGGDDSLYNSADDATINGGEGNDTIRNVYNDDYGGDGVSISGGAGADSIQNVDAYDVSIDAGDGADAIYNNGGHDAYINAGSGNDSIYSSKANNLTVLGGADNDTIKIYRSKNSKIDGGSGNDLISLKSSAGTMTVIGGAGDDTIYGDTSKSVIYFYSSGDGNDFIYNYKSTDKISLGGGYYTRETLNGNVIVSIVGSGAMTLNGASNKTINITGGTQTILSNIINLTSGNDQRANYTSNATINALAGNDYIWNYADYVSINAGTGNDTLNNRRNYNTILGGAGNDYFHNDPYNNGTISSAHNTKLYGEAGNDTMQNFANKVSMYGGAGADSIVNFRVGYVNTVTVYGGEDVLIDAGADNDYIYSGGRDNGTGTVTIIGGTGNDSIQLADNSNNNLIVYNYGDGNDSIRGYDANDTISIVGGVYKTSTVNTNVVISVAAANSTVPTGAMTLVGASGKTLNIVGTKMTENVTLSNTISNILINGSSGNDSIKSTNASKVTISTGAGNDTIYNTLSSHTVNSYVSINAGEGNDSIYNLFGSAATILGGAGKDNIFDGSWYTFIDGGDDDDSINANNYGQTINGGSGNDTIVYSGDYASINGGNDNDTIFHTGSKTTLRGGAGNDFISVSSSGGNIFQYGFGDGNDSIIGYTASDTLSLASGLYYTRETVSGNVVVSLTSGGAMTLSGASGKTINITGGIQSIKSSVTSLTSGNDSSIISASNVTIDALAGNDSINIRGSAVSINGGAGNDMLDLDPYYFGSVRNVTLTGGAGNDTFVVDPYNSNTISAVITDFTTSDVFVYDSDFDDSGNKKLTYQISGGNMIIQNNQSSAGATINPTFVVTLKGISSLDQISSAKYYRVTNWSTGTKYENTTFGELFGGGGSSNKNISNSNNDTVITTGSGNDSIYTNANNVTISSGSGNDTINNSFANNISIDAGDGEDSIYGNNNYATINAGIGKDTIIGNHWRSKLNGNDGDDLISITTYYYNTIDGGAGNDTIIAGGDEHSVFGGAGDDYVSLSGTNLTINGGTGNDTIYGDSTQSHLYQYSKGDGNDVIYNFGANDSITISGSTWTKSNSGNNVVIKVANSGNITLVGAKGKTLNIYPAKSGSSNDSYTPQDVIMTFMKALDDTNNFGEAAMDDAVKACSNYTSIQGLIDKLYRECKSYVSSDPTNGWRNFLLEKCDIDLTNDDTGAITGSDAGGDTEKTATSVIPESGYRNTNFTSDYFSTNGATFRLGDNRTFSNLTSDEKFVWQSMYTYWANSGLDLINESYGYNFADSETKTDTIYIYFTNNSGRGLAWTSISESYYTQRASSLGITVNMNYYYNFGNYDVNGISPKNQEYLDRTFTHEMVHAIMAAKVNKFLSLPISIIEGTAELVKGIDDSRSYSISQMAKNPDYLKYYLNVNDTRYQDNTDNMYAAGYILLRYLAKQASNGTDTEALGSYIFTQAEGVSIKGAVLSLTTKFTDNAIDLADYSALVTKVDASKLSNTVNIYANASANSIKGGKGADKIYAGEGKDTVLGGAGADVIYGEKDNDLLKGEAGNDTIYGGAGNDTLYGGANDDVLYGNADNDKLLGEAGNDILNGGAGNDTLTGGAGADIFVYENGGGNDVITDYTASQKDKIQIVNGTITNTKISGTDVIYTIGEGTLTVKKGKSQNISIEYITDNEIGYNWFIADDNNFISNDTQIDSISEVTADNYSAGNLETPDYSTLAQDKNMLTFAKK